MIEIIPVKQRLKANISMPGSKSITNRALLIAALAKGKTVLHNALQSEDTLYMQKALQQLGVKILAKGNTITVYGQGGTFKATTKEIFLGNAGTAVRFLTAACSLGTLPYTITGNAHMQKRPIAPLIDALKQVGLQIDNESGCPPLTLKGGKFKGGKISIDGSLSSQYISALLMVSPLSEQNTKIKILNKLSSKPYIDVTLSVMKEFGAMVHNNSYENFEIKGGQSYKAKDFIIEGDYSSASYFAAIAALTQSDIKIENLKEDSTQGDRDFFRIMEKMGCEVSYDENSIHVKGQEKLKALGKINLNHMPDAALTVAVLAACAKGKSHLSGLSTLKVKETDRLKAMETELKKVGVDVIADNDSLLINGDPTKLKGAEIDTYEDHRMAMCFATLGTVIEGVKIKNPDCVQKSYSSFWGDLKKIGVQMKDHAKSNIVLIGMRGSGKSRIGKKLALALNKRFIDLDEEVERTAQSSIQSMVQEKGWDFFRKQEKAVCSEFAKRDNQVIASGGGIVLDEENMQMLQNKGRVIFLECDIEKLAYRIKNSKNRPSLTGKKIDEELREIWQNRKDLYEKYAEIKVNVSKHSKNPNQDLEEKLKLFSKP